MARKYDTFAEMLDKVEALGSCIDEIEVEYDDGVTTITYWAGQQFWSWDFVSFADRAIDFIHSWDFGW